MRKEIVLFIDDEKGILKALRRTIKDDDFTPIFVENGKTALEIIKYNNISVIVADIGLIDIDGVELLTIIEKEYPKIVKIALTGVDNINEVYNIFEHVNLYKYVTKPWDTNELINYINEGLLESRRNNKQDN